MDKCFRKLFGVSLMIVVKIGMVFSAFGVVGVWIVHTSIITSVEHPFGLLLSTLKATLDGLLIIDDTMDTAEDTLATILQTTQTMANSL